MPGLKRDNTRSPDWPPAKQTCGLGTRKCVARLPYSLAGQACTAEPAGPAGAHQRVLDVQRVALQRGVAALQRGVWVARLALHLVVLVCLVGIGLHGQRPADAALLRVAQHLRARLCGAAGLLRAGRQDAGRLWEGCWYTHLRRTQAGTRRYGR